MTSHPQIRQTKLNAGVRLATADDIPLIASLTNAAFSIEAFITGTRTDEPGVAEMMQKGIFLVAENPDHRVVASVYIELRGSRAYFGMLAVDPSQQGTGLGRLMVEAAENHARQHGCSFMDITVLSQRPELLPLYRKLGYTETGTEEFHPNRPLKPGVKCHCITMSNPL
ncbi:MAG TPA: GNAT family N-acetyltransferase [Terriglobales bacterium]